MKRKIIPLITLFFTLSVGTILAQDSFVHPTEIVTGTYYGVSKALRDLPPMSKEEYQAIEQKAREKQFNESLQFRNYPYESTALPKGNDPVWQREMGQNIHLSRSPIVNFNGQNSPYYPPDDNGTAGPNHYMQTINSVYAIYNKTGTLVAGPTNLNQLFGSVPGANRNDGDPIILYDEEADRWLVTEFSVPNSGPNYMLMAVSTTNDPTGTWHQYSFQVAAMPDYPKFGIWQDGYYMGDNNYSGNDIYVMERTPMLSGGVAQMVGFNNPNRPASSDGFMCVPPLDNDGPFAPAGSPGLYIAFNDDALGGGSDQLWIYELEVDWTIPSNSTFGRTQLIDVEPFNANFGPTWNNIPQAGTSQKLDGIPQVVMNVPQYRNFGTYETMVLCHTVKVDGTGLAGIRWYELRRTTGDWSVRQQGTYAPDTDSRWMGSIMLNGNETIALGYSISSTTLHPSIRYAGQSPGHYANASGILDITEETIFESSYSQNSANRWGDYALMCVDPVDDETFWFTTQYPGAGGARKTRIASFSFANIMSVSATATPSEICIGDDIQLNVDASGGSGSYTYSWASIPAGFTSNLQNPTANPTETTKYYCDVDDGTQVKSDTAYVTVNTDPDVNAGDDQTLLNTVQIVNLDATASNYMSLLWTTPGDGYFWKDTVLSNYYYPGPTDLANGVILTLSATPKPTCTATVADDVTIHFVPAVGVPEEGAETFSLTLMPNPTKGLVTMKLNGLGGFEATVSITSIQGKFVHREVIAAGQTKATSQVDLNGFPSGIYLVRVQSQLGNIVQKLVIE
ncbi:T9SS type A sorting domain-containing protein [Bacteroidota bacterium]